MSFAEIILRIGTAVGGWVIFIGHALTLAVLPEADCDPSSDELWRGTLLFGFLSAGGLICVSGGIQWHHQLRMLAAPAAFLALWAAYQISSGLTQTTLGGASLCVIAQPELASLTGVAPSSIERMWTPIQLAVLAFGLFQAYRYWTATMNPDGSESS